MAEKGAWCLFVQILGAAAAISLIAVVLIAKRHKTGIAEGATLSFRDRESLVESIRNGLKAHSSRIIIQFDSNGEYAADIQDIVNGLMKEAMRPTGKAMEGDYLRYQIGGYTVSYGCEDTWSHFKNVIYIEPEYYTTLEAEAKVTAAVRDILSEMRFTENTSDHEKVEAIYGYLYDNVKYDKIHRNNKHYHLNATTYAALIHKNASCQGYCVAMSRLMLEAGVDCKIITGFVRKEGETEFHAWNLVRIDGVYYNLDITWNKQLETQDYYLKCDADFPNHVRDAEFDTEAFRAAYVMAEENYQQIMG